MATKNESTTPDVDNNKVTTGEVKRVEEKKMVKVRIPRTRPDEEDVFVSVNMETFIVKRGVEVEVPDYVAEVLRHQEEMLEARMVFNQKNSK